MKKSKCVLCEAPTAKGEDYCEDPIACQKRLDKALDPGVNPITGAPNPPRTITPGFGMSFPPEQHAGWAVRNVREARADLLDALSAEVYAVYFETEHSERPRIANGTSFEDAIGKAVERRATIVYRQSADGALETLWEALPS